MSRKQTLIKGTLVLTATGFTTRFMGFFYRIFLSHSFGEENVGLYQLIFPIYAMGFSLTCAGTELALSRSVARYLARGEKEKAGELLSAALFISISLSLVFLLFIQHYAQSIALYFLHDIRCEKLLLILSYIFPFSALHSCICGYYLGIKKTRTPALSQLMEQAARIGFVFLLFDFGVKQGQPFGIGIAVAGLAAGEVFSSLYCLRQISRKERITFSSGSLFSACKLHGSELLLLSLPLTASRVLLNILQSIEAVSIPVKLQTYGMDTGDALSAYGVLTGMALPCILFPSAITNSISTMLLPTVAEIQAVNDRKQLSFLIRKICCSCIFLGSICCAGLLIFGRFMGSFLFHSPLAGDFIVTLAWICPFLYTNNTLISILNGIGKATLSFMINAVSLGIRIIGVFFFIPSAGIHGYLWGLLISQLCVFFYCLFYLKYYMSHNSLDI